MAHFYGSPHPDAPVPFLAHRSPPAFTLRCCGALLAAATLAPAPGTHLPLRQDAATLPVVHRAIEITALRTPIHFVNTLIVRLVFDRNRSQSRRAKIRPTPPDTQPECSASPGAVAVHPAVAPGAASPMKTAGHRK